MRKICTRCLTVAEAGTNWCRNDSCPPGTLTDIFDFNDHFGHFTIQKVARIFRTATLYTALRPGKRREELVYLKVSHSNYQNMLKFEARLFHQADNSSLLTLLDPLPQATRQPYAKLAVHGEPRYYFVMEYIDGTFLRDMVAHIPPSEQHAIWITLELANTIAYVNKKLKALVLGLMPDSILIHMDKQGVPRPYLMDLGLAQPIQTARVMNYAQYGHISYFSPEQFKALPISTRTDVYGLGLLLYEMLAGGPAFNPSGRRDETLLEDIFKSRVVPLEHRRPELRTDLVHIVNRAIDAKPERRFRSVGEFARQLRSTCNEQVPSRAWHLRLNRQALALVLFALIFLTIICLLLVIAAP